jgi:hypothetical protein
MDHLPFPLLVCAASTEVAPGHRELPRADRAAIDSARRSETPWGCVTLPGDAHTREYALAAGGHLVEMTSVSILPALTLAGTGFVEAVGDQQLAEWSERSEASLLFDVLSWDREGNELWMITRDAGRGRRDLLSVAGAVTLVLSPGVARPSYVSRHRRTLARRSAEFHRAVTGDGRATADAPWELARPRPRAIASTVTSLDDRLDAAFGSVMTASASSDRVVTGDPERCANELLRFLAHHGFVRPSTVSASLAAPTIESPAISKATSAPSTELPRPASAHRNHLQRRWPRQPGENPERVTRAPRPVSSLDSIGESGLPDASPAHATTHRRPRPLGRTRPPDRGPRRID